MQDINKRFDKLEDRLFNVEQMLGLSKPAEEPVIAKEVVEEAVPIIKPAMPLAEPVVQVGRVAAEEPVSATRLMAWCAGLTFILAMIYFLKLVYDSGWLTPVRQIGLAYLAASGLITAGFFLEKRDRQYAAYLPAVGIVLLYLTTFTAHLYFHMFDRPASMVVIGIITLLGIWLGRKFDNSVYVIFSAVGVYITPLFIHSDHGQLIDLVIYYSAWSLLFSFCAIQEEKRITYLLPMYLAMLGFDFIWRMAGSDEWVLAASFQCIQFLIFSGTTVLFSIVHREPMNTDNSVAHGLALLLFYSLEYALLKQHVPESVNYIAVLSAVFVYMLFLVARKFYKGEASLEQGATLVSWYCSWVALHAVFFGIVSARWLPWAAMLTPVIFLFLASQFKDSKKPLIPVALACGALCFLGYGMLVFGMLTKEHMETPMPTLALFFYVVMLYGIYYQFSRSEKPSSHAVLALYGGHLALIACMIEVVHRDIYLSTLWASYAVILLLVAMQWKDKVLGQSALLIFSAAGLKVLLFDLSDSNSIVKVGVLLALSVSLYLGGWLYQSLIRGINKS